jgi:hypothetical protein
MGEEDMKWLKKLFGKRKQTPAKTPKMLYGCVGEEFNAGLHFRYPYPTHKIIYDVDKNGNVLFCEMRKMK